MEYRVYEIDLDKYDGDVRKIGFDEAKELAIGHCGSSNLEDLLKDMIHNVLNARCDINSSAFILVDETNGIVLQV